MYCLDIVFDLHDRLPEPGLAALLAFLKRQPAGTTAGVYGYGLAGQAIVRRLRAEPVVRLAAVFDKNTGLADAATPVHPPEAMARFSGLDLLVVTVPPQHTFAVGELVARHCPETRLVLLYDLDRLDVDSRSYHNLLLELHRAGPQPPDLEVKRAGIFGRINTRLRRWREERDRDAGLSPEQVGRRIAEANMDLGQYLFDRLRRGVDALGRADGGPQLLEGLAREFPYFAPAREALASHHVERGDFRPALAAYEPILRHYPRCYHSLTRRGELRLLCGDRDGARADFEAGQRLNPRDPLLADCLAAMARGRTPDPLPRWSGRLGQGPGTVGRGALRCAAAVWGEDYLRTFMRCNLRSMLAPGNLPYAAGKAQLRFDLYTRPEDAASLDGHPEWRALRELATVEVIPLEKARQAMGDASPNKYSILTCCQNDALERSLADGAMTYLTMGDLIHSGDFIGHGLDRLLAGDRAVLFPASLRFVREAAQAALDREAPGAAVLDFDGVRLFRMLENDVHPASRHYLDDEYTCDVPGVLLWRARNGSLLQHVFFINAFFMAPLEGSLRMNSTLDVDLGYRVTDGCLGRFHLIRDLGRAAVFELTAAADLADFQRRLPRDQLAAAHWLQYNTDPVNRCLGTFSCLYRRDEDFSGLEALRPRAAAEMTRLLA